MDFQGDGRRNVRPSLSRVHGDDADAGRKVRRREEFPGHLFAVFDIFRDIAVRTAVGQAVELDGPVVFDILEARDEP